MAMQKSVDLILLCLRPLVMLVGESVLTVYTILLAASARSVGLCITRILLETSGNPMPVFVSICNILWCDEKIISVVISPSSLIGSCFPPSRVLVSKDLGKIKGFWKGIKKQVCLIFENLSFLLLDELIPIHYGPILAKVFLIHSFFSSCYFGVLFIDPFFFFTYF